MEFKNLPNSIQLIIVLTVFTEKMLTDEQQALQLAFTSLEEKFRKVQDDNNDLVTRWMAIKVNKTLILKVQDDNNDIVTRWMAINVNPSLIFIFT